MQKKTHTVTLTQVSSCPSTESYHHLQTEMHTLVLIQTGVISAAVGQGHSQADGCKGPIYKQDVHDCLVPFPPLFPPSSSTLETWF